MTVATAHSGNWYSIVGTVGEVRDEVNRINAKPDRLKKLGDDGSGTFTLLVYGNA